MEHSNSDLERHPSNQPYGTSTGPANLQRPGATPIPWNLVHFYTNDGPWVAPTIPVSPSQPSGDQKVPGTLPGQSHLPSFQGYRNRLLPSENDTLAGDSGYGGTATASYSNVDTTSCYEDDRSPETQFAARGMERLHLQTEVSSETQFPGWQRPPCPPSAVSALSNGDRNYHCRECNDWFRTKSELRKHALRHTKPFVCDMAGCRRNRTGFSTKNDLERHKKTVHSDYSVSGRRFVCRHGTCDKEEPKIWPRADNFRSHLFRVHHIKVTPESDLEAYIYRPSSHHIPQRQALEGVGAASYLNVPRSTPRSASISLQCQELPEAQEVFDPLLQDAKIHSGNDTSVLDSAKNNEDDDTQPDNLDISMSQPGQNNGRPFYPRPLLTSPADNYEFPTLDQDLPVADTSLLIDEDENESTEIMAPEDTENPDPSDADMNQSRNAVPDAPKQDMPQPRTEEDSETPSQSQSTSSSSSTSDSLPQIPTSLETNCAEILQYIRNLPKETFMTVVNTLKSETDEEAPHKTQHRCTLCPNKYFNRPCELKKHMKRHDRPYGCTFKDCTKEFGSKNDWKRHESSQHSRLETWRCEETVKIGKCRKVFQRRDLFKQHLHNDHNMTDSKEKEERLDRCRIGRHCEAEFWCGFCRDIISTGMSAEKGNAWTFRCNHIDDHFCGRSGNAKQKISEWKHPEDAFQESVTAPISLKSHPMSLAPTALANINDGLGTKRKAGDDMDAENDRPRKRQEKHEIFWRCCSCGDSTRRAFSGDMCLACGVHQRCEYCEYEFVEKAPADKLIAGG